MKRMTLVQILLPLYDGERKPLPGDVFERVRHELTERFGGLTAYTRSPAEGRWKQDERHVEADDIVVFEVMVRHLAQAWWRAYRDELQRRFGQDVIIIRAQETRML